MTQQLKDFLLEIGTEELPPQQIGKLTSSLANNLEQGLEKLSIKFTATKLFSSPRRIAVLITGLSDKQPDQKIERKGPSVEIAFDKEGNPTVAAQKFAKSCDVDLSELKRVEEKKKVFLIYQATVPGKNTIDLLPELIADSIKNLPIKKPMYWGKKQGPFIRPVHWVLALFGNETIKVDIFGIPSTNKTCGHRFHHPQEIIIPEPNQYEKLLSEKGYVIVNHDKRKEKIVEQIETITKTGSAVITEELLTEVTNIVE